MLEPQTTGRAPTAQVAIKTTEGEASNYHQVGLVTGKFFIGLYDYESRQRNDISFKKGNRLELLDDRYCNVLFFFVTFVPNFVFVQRQRMVESKAYRYRKDWIHTKKLRCT